MPYPDGNPTLTEQLEEDERRRFYTDDIIKEAKELKTERDVARAQAKAWKKDAEERLPQHVYQEVCDLNTHLTKQVAVLREALETQPCPYPIAGLNTVGDCVKAKVCGCLTAASQATLTDTEEAAAQYQRVPGEPVERWHYCVVRGEPEMPCAWPNCTCGQPEAAAPKGEAGEEG